MRSKNDLLEKLDMARQQRAREVLNDLAVRGVKKIGKERVGDLEKQEGELDYDAIMTTYANILRREREAFELNKTKKNNDVEIWTRAIKEEEKAAMDAYCQTHGQAEIEQIQKAMTDRHAKELATKHNLASAKAAYEAYMAK